MKVLQVNKYFFIKGGADRVFFDTIEMLKERGCSVVTFSTEHPDNYSAAEGNYFIKSPEIRNLPPARKIGAVRRFISNPDAARAIESVIIKEKPDVAHLHNIFNGISLSILPVLKKHHVPVIFMLHDARLICPSSLFNLRGTLCANCRKSFFLNCALHKCYQNSRLYSLMCAMEMFHKEFCFDYDRYVSRYVFVSQAYRDFHCARHSFFKDKSDVLYNSTEIEERQGETIRGDYFLFCGRVTEEKGVKTLVHAFQGKKAHLKIAGTGPLTASLKEDAGANVEFLGFLSGDALAEAIRKSSFVVVPSEWEENNPLSVIEAYSYGKPVIGSRIGGIPEIIEEGHTGFTFEAFNPEDLSRVIDKASALSDEVYAEISIAAKNFARRNFNKQNYCDKLMNIYQKALHYENI
jgi:glycosyltransferase involved in cell wall biosynthesis